MVALKRCVHFSHDFDRGFIFGADDDTSGAVEVIDGRAFLEKFGIRYHAERESCIEQIQFRLNRLFDLVGHANRKRSRHASILRLMTSSRPGS